MDIIFIRELRVQTTIGVHPWERRVRQTQPRAENDPEPEPHFPNDNRSARRWGVCS